VLKGRYIQNDRFKCYGERYIQDDQLVFQEPYIQEDQVVCYISVIYRVFNLCVTGTLNTV
jgi:hypothetical protein